MNTAKDKTISRANKYSSQKFTQEKFTQAYKRQVLEKGARCRNVIELQALLHNEKLHAAQLSKWWREFSTTLSFERRYLKPAAQGTAVPILTEVPKMQPKRDKQALYAHANQPSLINGIFETIWRGRWAFSTTIIISMLISAAYVRNVTPLYTAHALLEVETQQSDLLFQTMTQPNASGPYDVQREIEILRSYPLTEKVADKLNLDQTPLLNPEIREKTFFANLFNGYRPQPHVTQEDLAGVKVLLPTPLPESVTLVENVLNGLNVDQINRSRIIKVSYTSASPQLAANIANAIVETYISTQGTEAAIQWSDVQTQMLPQGNTETSAYTIVNDQKAMLINRSRNIEEPIQKINLKPAEMGKNNHLDMPGKHKVVSYAYPPTEAVFPKVLPTLLFASLGSILLGLLSILIQALSRKGFRGAAEIEQHTGYTSLGMIPKLGLLQTRLTKPSDYVLKCPNAPFSAAVHSVYSNIVLANRRKNHLPKVIQFTSAYPEEGSSTIAHCLAVIKRQSGIKTVIIDANIRKPGLYPDLYKGSVAREQAGLAEYLTGKSAVHEIITRQKQSGPYHIIAGQSNKNPADLLSSRRIDELFAELKEVFDLIIVDSPPVLAVPDARILADRVDMTTLVVKWGETRKEVVQYALRQLSNSGSQQLTTLLTMVDTRKHAQDNCADSGVYFGNLGQDCSMRSLEH